MWCHWVLFFPWGSLIPVDRRGNWDAANSPWLLSWSVRGSKSKSRSVHSSISVLSPSHLSTSGCGSGPPIGMRGRRGSRHLECLTKEKVHVDPSEAHIWVQRVQSGQGIWWCSFHLYMDSTSGPGIRELGRLGTTGSPPAEGVWQGIGKT